MGVTPAGALVSPIGIVDRTGARITSVVFSGTTADTFDTVRLTLSETIDASSFNTADVTLTGRGGAIPPTNVAAVGGSTTQFDVTFPV